MATKNYLEGIVKISKANYDILKAGGTVDGYKYDPKTVYMVQYDDDTIVYTNNNQIISGNKTFTGDTVVYDLTVNDGITISDPDKRSDKLFFATDGSIQEIEIESVTFEEAEEEGKEGVADALSYHDVIIENERVTAAAFNAVANSVGLGSEFDVDWEGYFDEGTTIVDAIKKNSIPVEHITKITYADLVNKRKAGELVPGLQYRIVDYEFTTASEWCISAGHQFDIIVTAVDVDELSCDALATWHDGDEYFSNDLLTGWTIKYTTYKYTYSLVNYKEVENYKGLIYYMEDEKGNVCDYDFKNAMFKRAKATDASYTAAAGLIGEYVIDLGTLSSMLSGNGEDVNYFYTFSRIDDAGNVSDFSKSNNCRHNKVIAEGRLNPNSFVIITTGNNAVLDNTYRTSFDTYTSGTVIGARIAGNSFLGNCIVMAGNLIVNSNINTTGGILRSSGYIAMVDMSGTLVALATNGRLFNVKMSNCYVADFDINGTLQSLYVNIDGCDYVRLSCNGNGPDPYCMSGVLFQHVEGAEFNVAELSQCTFKDSSGNTVDDRFYFTSTGRLMSVNVRNWHRGSITASTMLNVSMENLHRINLTFNHDVEDGVVQNLHDKTYSSTAALNRVILQSDETNVINI